MKYKESAALLEKIKKAKKVLLNCHRSPDCDSIGSSLAMAEAVRSFGAETTIICPSEVEEHFYFMEGADKIKTIDFSSFDFSVFDLFILLDSSSEEQITDKKGMLLPPIPRLIVDHHVTNIIEAGVRLVDADAPATAQIVFDILNDWQQKISPSMATALLAGLATDTVFFKYASRPESAYRTAAALMAAGADQQTFVRAIYNNHHIDAIRLLGKLLDRINFDAENKFVWAAVPYALFEEYGKQDEAKEIAANLFIQSIRGAEFGFIAFEKKPGRLSVSFRSKGKVDVSALAKSLGGGGHKNAAGLTIEGEFEELLEKIIRKAIETSAK